MKYIVTIILSFITFIKQSHQTEYSGIATMYGGQINGGACGFKKFNNNFVNGVAINAEQYNNSLACGSYIHIKSNLNYQDSIVMVTDICPECKLGDLDLFKESYDSIIQKPYGREPIKWEFIDCPETYLNKKGIELHIDEINYYWLAIRPQNIKCQLSEIYISINNKWELMERNDNKMTGLYFIYDKQKLEFPIRFKLINKYYEEIITDDYYNLENILFTNKQFLCSNNNNNNNIIEFECN